MKEYRITRRETVECSEKNLAFENEAQIKVKISKALIDDDVCRLFESGAKEADGTVPVTSAAAVISDPQSNKNFSRGERVYVDPYVPCRNCYNCKTDASALCQGLSVMGQTEDGFLTEFKLVSPDSINSLPDSVSDESALFIEYVARAIAILDRLNASKGEYIVVCGSDILSNILSQLSLYYQIIPILVTNSERNTDIAKKAGVYYTTAADQNAVGFIRQITGGRMAENFVGLSSGQLPAKYIADCCASGANVVFSGDTSGNFISYSAALKKQLSAFFVSNGYGNITAAINVLANKAVKTDKFIRSTAEFSETETAFISAAAEDKDTSLISAVSVNI